MQGAAEEENKMIGKNLEDELEDDANEIQVVLQEIRDDLKSIQKQLDAAK